MILLHNHGTKDEITFDIFLRLDFFHSYFQWSPVAYCTVATQLQYDITYDNSMIIAFLKSLLKIDFVLHTTFLQSCYMSLIYNLFV